MAKYGGTNRIAQLEEAAGISHNEGKTPPAPATGMDREYRGPYGKGEFIKSGERAREWAGPRPWKK